MISLYVSMGMAGLVGQAFFIAAAMFAVTSLIGYTTKKDMTGWSGFLSMASIGMIIVMLASFFFITDPGTSKMMSMGISAVVVLLFSVMTAFETQAIKSMYIENAQHGGEAQLKRSSIFGAFMLYGSFITLFIHILNLLGLANQQLSFDRSSIYKRPRFPGPFLFVEFFSFGLPTPLRESRPEAPVELQADDVGAVFEDAQHAL